MKLKAVLLTSIILSTMLMDANAQLTGKTYEGRVRYTCKMMAGGGCAITTFCVLRFSGQTVDVYYYAKASCTPQEREADYSYDGSNEKKTYKWSQSGHTISIEGFKEYGTFKLKEDKLISSKKTDEDEELEFIEKSVE